MIKVDNSYKRRIFVTSEEQEVLDLKSRVECKLNEIENGEADYEDLNEFDAEIHRNKISVFIYKAKIDTALNELIPTIVK